MENSRKEDDIDVARILEEVKKEVMKEGYSFTDFDSPIYEINPEFPIRYHRPILGRINYFVKSLIRKSLRWYIVPIVEQMNVAMQSIANRLEELKLDQRLGRIERLSRSLSQKIDRLKEGEIPPVSGEISARVEEPEGLDYFLFQERYRGSEEEIKDRERVYVDCFRDSKGVVDIGCGRGEFLELLRENGIEARGIELDEDMVLLCQEKGFAVEREGALSYLARTPDGSLGGVFMAQVVEHLKPQDVSKLMKLCYEKLEPRAPLVAETINPTSKSGMDWFYLDMSHQRPLHPSALKLLLESLGFSRVKIRYVNPVPEEGRLKKLLLTGRLSKRERDMVESFNRNVEILNKHLFGYQDYAVIALK